MSGQTKHLSVKTSNLSDKCLKSGTTGNLQMCNREI